MTKQLMTIDQVQKVNEVIREWKVLMDAQARLAILSKSPNVGVLEIFAVPSSSLPGPVRLPISNADASAILEKKKNALRKKVKPLE